MFRRGINAVKFYHLHPNNAVHLDRRFFSATTATVSSTKKNTKVGDPEIDSLIKIFTSLLEDRKAEELNRQHKEHNLHKQINKNELYKEQMRLEEEQYQESIEEYKNTMKNLTNIEKATSTAAAKRTLVRWYGPVTENLNKLLVEIATDEKMKVCSSQSIVLISI
jgi:exonuclease VII large subunit